MKKEPDYKGWVLHVEDLEKMGAPIDRRILTKLNNLYNIPLRKPQVATQDEVTGVKVYPVEPKIVNYIPYQACPICGGSGEIQNYDLYNITSATISYTCHACSGAGIIPMHSINE